MRSFNPLLDPSGLRAQLNSSSALVIACYCAAWCNSCKKYEEDFNILAQRWPQYTFAWIDIEENPELLGDEDVENFPTVAIQSAAGNLFFGALLPHIDHLDRLIRHTAESDDPLPAGPPLLRSIYC
jgi:thioredoxin 1